MRLWEVAATRPINLDRITVRRGRVLGNPRQVWIIISSERFPSYRSQEITVQGHRRYLVWFYSWDFALGKLDHWLRTGCK